MFLGYIYAILVLTDKQGEEGFVLTLDKQTLKKLRWLIVFTLLAFILLWRFDKVVYVVSFLGGILAPFILGGAIAFILSVPMACLERLFYKLCKKETLPEKRLRPFSLILTLLLVSVILALVILVIFPELGSTISSLGKTIQTKLPILLAEFDKFLRDNKEIAYWLNNINFNWEEIMQKILAMFQTGADFILGSTFSIAQSIFSGVTTFVIGLVFACYILIQKEKLREQCRKVLYAYLKPQQAERVFEIATLTHHTFAKFLTGQCLEAVILGTMFFVSMTIFKFPYALLVGVLISVTALIPIFGAFIGCIVATFLILVVNPPQAIGFIILFFVLQQLEGNFIYPYVVGGSVGLPSIWVLVAVTLGGSLMGIIGMLIFIPLMSVLYTLFRQDVYKRLEQKNIQSS